MGYLAAAHKDSIAWLCAGTDVMSLIGFITHCCFSDLFPPSSTMDWFHCWSFSETVSDCDCELHYAEASETLPSSPALHIIK